MSLTKEDIAQIINAQNKKDERDKIIDWLFKALMAVIVWLVLGLTQDVDVMKVEVQKISNDREYYKKDLEAFKSFTEKPRFTADDFNQRIAPIESKVLGNSNQIIMNQAVISKTEQKLIRIELLLEDLINK